MLAAGGKGVLGSWEARAKCVKGCMVVLMAVGLHANAPVHSCIVCCSICLMVASDGRDDRRLELSPKMCIKALTGPDSSTAARRDFCPVLFCCTAYMPA